MEEGVLSLHIFLDQLLVLVRISAADNNRAVGCLHPAEAVIPLCLQLAGGHGLFLLGMLDACFHRTVCTGLLCPELLCRLAVPSGICLQAFVDEDGYLVLLAKVQNNGRLLRIDGYNPLCRRKVTSFENFSDVLPGHLLTCRRQHINRLLHLSVVSVDNLSNLVCLGDFLVKGDNGCFLLFPDAFLAGETLFLFHFLHRLRLWIEGIKRLREGGKLCSRLASKGRTRERTFRINYRRWRCQAGNPGAHGIIDRAKLGIFRVGGRHGLGNTCLGANLFGI